MFEYAASFNQPLDKWDVSKVTEMCSMFAGAKAFNQPLDKWDVSSVKEMRSIFEGATSFNQPKTLRRCVRPCMHTQAHANEQPPGSLGANACRVAHSA